MSAADEAITCVVADDHPAVLEAVVEYLEQSGINVVARAHDGDEALEQIEQRKPQVALIDVRMPKLGGIELTRRVQRSTPATAILLYTGYGDRALLTEALDAGVNGFVLKEAPMEDLLRAVKSVAAGGHLCRPSAGGDARGVVGRAHGAGTARAASAMCSGSWRTASRTRRSARSSTSRPRRSGRTFARRWPSSMPTRVRRQWPGRCAIT